jgi:hypothetical protein
MRGLLFRSLGAVLILAFLLASLSCAHDQQLVSISVQPGTETFGDSNTPVSADAGLSVNLRALGSYIHPPVTKDITNQVTWISNTPNMVTVDPSGVLTATGSACGNALVFATVQTNSSAGGLGSSGALVTGSMQANVVCLGSSSGGGSSDLNLTVGITGSGTVSSTPPGLGCSFNCVGSFPSGMTIVLTATPTGSATTANWVGCDSMAANICTVTLLTNRTVSVTFS